MRSGGADRRLLVVGGFGGLVGRAVLPEFLPDYELVSVHRHPNPSEVAAGVHWFPADIAEVRDWGRLLEGVDVVLNLAWYRWGTRFRFRRLHGGLRRLLDASRQAGVGRFLHLSVPPAPAGMERWLPYLAYKRQFDRELGESGLSYRILRPTMMFGPKDKLLTVMLRLMDRYPRFPMFGDGSYHVSPVAVTDVARLLRMEAGSSATGTVDVGGPERFRYRDLTDLMFQLLGKPARYWRLGPRGAVALAKLLQDFGSSLLYAYEVEWLMSDLLGLPAYRGLGRPLERVEPFLRSEVARRRGGDGRPGLPLS